jgi:hypothetical protein
MDAISLSVEAGSLKLTVTISPADKSEAGVASLTAAIGSIRQATLSEKLGSTATIGEISTTMLEQEFAATCPKGHWCSAGILVACPESTYQPEIGKDNQGACQNCPEGSFTSGQVGRTSIEDCVCAKGKYALWLEGKLKCIDCMVGANCTSPKVSLTQLPLLKGYWRANNQTTDVRRCPGTYEGSACLGCGLGTCSNPGFTDCRDGLGGPYCGLCTVDDGSVYFDQEKRECLPCRPASVAIAVVVPLVLLFACLLLGCAVNIGRKKYSWWKYPLPTVFHWKWFQRARSLLRQLATPAKILITFYQIATKVGETYQVTYPKSVEQTLAVFSWASLQFDGLGLPLACVALGGFKNQLLFMTLAPLVLLLLTVPIGWQSPNHTQEAPSPNSNNLDKHGWLRQTAYRALPLALRITFFAFPAVSSLAFQALPANCNDLDASDNVDYPSVMSADFAVVCKDESGEFTKEYEQILLLASVSIFLYPICVPCLYICLLFQVRNAMWSDTPTGLSGSITFLTKEYSTPYFFWEVIEVLKKLLLVGVMSVVLPGEINQLVIAWCCVLCFQTTLLVAKPYKRPADNVIALAAGFCLVVLFFLLARPQVPDPD